MTLVELDEALTAVAGKVARAFDEPWQCVRYEVRWNPAGDTSGDDYWLASFAGTEVKKYPDVQAAVEVSDASHHHWKLTQDLGQPRWYKMIVTVERSGKFRVDFEYKDDYKEGDILQRG